MTFSEKLITLRAGRGWSQERLAKELGVFVLPMPFLIDGETYFEDISLSQPEFYAVVHNSIING